MYIGYLYKIVKTILRFKFGKLDFRDFVSSTPTTANTKNKKKEREEIKSCPIHFHLSHGHSLNEKKSNCLGIQKNPDDGVGDALRNGWGLVWRADCSNIQEKELHWILLVADYNSAAEWNQSNRFAPMRHICNAHFEGKCLTLSSDTTSAAVTLGQFNASEKLQKWRAPFDTIPTATPIRSYDLNKCLTRKTSSVITNNESLLSSSSKNTYKFHVNITAELCNSINRFDKQWILSPLWHNGDHLNPVCTSSDEIMSSE